VNTVCWPNSVQRAVLAPSAPAFLRLAQHRALAGIELGAWLHERARLARLGRAILPAVEHQDRDEIAVTAARVRLLLPGDGHESARERLVLVPGLISRSPPCQEHGPRIALKRVLAGVVVRDLVIVGDEKPWRSGMRSLQIRIGFVQRIAEAIVVERVALGLLVRPHAHRAAILVDVVADVRNEVGPIGGDCAVSGEIALLVVLARRDREGEPLRHGAGGGCRARSADGALLPAAREAVPIVASGLEARCLDVHGVRPLRQRVGAAAPHDPAHALVSCDFPCDFDGRSRESAAGNQRLGRQPCPKYHCIRPGIARRDTESEGVARKAQVGGARRKRPEDRGAGKTDTGAQDRPARTTHTEPR
jgi:hypothetical protein